MRFFQIQKSSAGTGQEDYSIKLFASEIKKENIAQHISTRTGALYPDDGFSDGIELDYYVYTDTIPARPHFYGKAVVRASTVGAILNTASVLNTFPSLDMRDVLKKLVSGGWRQVYHDHREWSFFLEENFPAQALAYYSFEIVARAEDGSCPKYYTFFAKDDAAAREQVLRSIPDSLNQIKNDKYDSKYYDAFLKAASDWMLGDMKYYNKNTVSPESYAWGFDLVKAQYILELITAPVQPSLPIGAPASEEGANV